MRILTVVLLVAGAFVCLRGFTLTFDPAQSGEQLWWRATYAVLGLACTLRVAWLLRESLRADHRPHPE